MPTWMKLVWIFALLVSISSILWFLLGSSANFQRSLDLVSTITLILVCIPTLVLSIISIILLIKGWDSPNINHIGIWSMLLALLFLAIPLFKGVNTEGWLFDSIDSDSIKMTSDKKYEYRIELINLFQKNSHERLYIRDVLTGQEMYIPININTKGIHGISVRGEDDLIWALMSPTDALNHYELTTTEVLPVPQKKFLIDIKGGISWEIM